MDSPANGQIAAPPGYKLDVSPPSGYVLDTTVTPSVPSMDDQQYPQNTPSPLDSYTATKVASQFPAYEEYLPKVRIHPGATTATDDRQSETYLPWESENPNPGKLTIQPYRRELLGPNNLPNTVAGEMLHYIGGIDDTTGRPIDPSYQQLKQKVAVSRTPKQVEIDNRAYQEARKHGEDRPFSEWFNQSRLDEYIMGYVTPDKIDEWRKNGFYDDPKMHQAVEEVRKYLTAPKKKPTKQ